MSTEFEFEPAAWLPFRDKKVIDKCRNIKREDMEKHPNPDFKIKIVLDVGSLFVADCFTRIKMSDDLDQKLVMIFPNPYPSAYSNLAELCDRFNVSCRNVHTFNMDEWADQDGNVAPITYKSGLGYSFLKYFYGNLRPDLRPKEDQVHYLTTKNVYDYSKLIEEAGGGGADICYSATGWPGHIAFIDPDTEEFACGSLEEFLTLGSRIVTQNPLTVAENSLFGIFGCSGDVYNVPPRAATIGPRDVKNARERFEMHALTAQGGFSSFQRMISRLTLYAPVTVQIPSTILQTMKTQVYVSEAMAMPIECMETVGY